MKKSFSLPIIITVFLIIVAFAPDREIRFIDSVLAVGFVFGWFAKAWIS